jgi:hypothetical protein
MKDLVVLTPGKDDEFTLRGLFTRPQALDIRPVEARFLIHPERDPGCYRRPQDVLRPLASQYSHALVMFDREGSGVERSGAAPDMEREVENLLGRNGWGGRVRCIVIEPELEIWVWANSRQVDECLGWANRQLSLRQWLEENGWLQPNQIKPSRPKEAMQATMREVGKQRSAAVFEALASRVSFQNCEDEAFGRLLSCLRGWFGPGPVASPPL